MEDERDDELRWSTDQTLLGVLTVIPGVMLALAIFVLVATPWTPAGLALLAAHLVSQFIVLLLFLSLLGTDPALDTEGRWMWTAGFLAAAPVALPIYFVHRALRSAPPVRIRVVDVA